jgi:GrpB-like predicted nucleotidyltransferase (UPF0157 family)
MIGLARGTVEVVPYTSQWSILFQQEQILLREALGELALDIQHIGSTAIPGLASKPIIDIGIAVIDLALVSQCIAPLTSLGYHYFGDREQRGDEFFAKGTEDRRTHYVHILALSHAAWQNYLDFRDYLIAHPTELESYARLKTDLATHHKHNRAAYTKAKNDFIKETLSKVHVTRNANTKTTNDL